MKNNDNNNTSQVGWSFTSRHTYVMLTCLQYPHIFEDSTHMVRMVGISHWSMLRWGEVRWDELIAVPAAVAHDKRVGKSHISCLFLHFDSTSVYEGGKDLSFDWWEYPWNYYVVTCLYIYYLNDFLSYIHTIGRYRAYGTYINFIDVLLLILIE